MSAAASYCSGNFLDETSGWTAEYAPGTLHTKRVKMFTAMAGASRFNDQP